MADTPIGISFMPTADAQANGPRQAQIEGSGGSDLAQAFKILSLHLPRVLGASAIAPKRLLTSQGSAAVAGPAGSSPYAAVFEALLHSLGAGSMGGGMADPMAPQSFASLFGGDVSGDGGDSGYLADTGAATSLARPPAPNVSFGGDRPDVFGGAPASTGTYSGPSASYTTENQREDTQYI